MEFIKTSWNNIINYFNNPDRNAKIRNFLYKDNELITLLIELGYANFYSKFKELIDGYSKLNNGLNTEELDFISKIELNYKFASLELKLRNLNIINISSHLRFYAMKDQLFYQKIKNSISDTSNKFYQIKIEKLVKEIQKIKPLNIVYKMRRYVKLILKQFIIKHLDLIGLINYYPELELFQKYKSKFFEKYGENEKLKNLYEEVKEYKLKNDNFTESNYNLSNLTDIQKKIFKQLLVLKNELNNIIHPSNYENSQFYKIDEENFEPSNNEEIKINIQEENINNKTEKIYFEKVLKFIVFDEPIDTINKELEQINSEFDLIKDELFNEINYFDKFLKDTLSFRLVEKLIEETKDKILKLDMNYRILNQKYIINFIENYNINNEDYEFIENNESDKIFNELFSKLNKKDKIIFKIDYDYIFLFYEGVSVIKEIKRIKEKNNEANIETKLKKLNELTNSLNEIQEKIKNLKIPIFNKNDFFTIMEKNSFFNEVQNDLVNIKFLNILEKEFNNPKFYIFLHKNKVFDDSVYNFCN